MKDFLLTIDKGNTNAKYRLYDRKRDKLKSLPHLHINDAIKEYDLDELNTDIIFSNVSSSHDDIPLFSCIDVSSYLEDGHFLDMPIDYAQTIGIDRVVQAYYLFKNRPLNSPIVFVDAGTFITIDIISREGLIGGLILPGTSLLLDTYAKGANLCVYSAEELESSINPLVDNYLAHNTRDAILLGVQNLLKSSILSIKNEFKCHQVYLSGGDAPILSKLILEEYDPELIFKSLLYIYKREALH